MFGIYNSFERKFVNRNTRGQNVHSGVKVSSTTPTTQFTMFVIVVSMLCLLHSFIPSFHRTLIVVTRFRGSCNLVNRSIVLVAHIWKLSLFSL
jgi:hypothetical protein